MAGEVGTNAFRFHTECLKNCTARSRASAALRVLNVPRLRRLPVFGFFLREYKRYLPLVSFRIIRPPTFNALDSIKCSRSKDHGALRRR